MKVLISSGKPYYLQSAGTTTNVVLANGHHQQQQQQQQPQSLLRPASVRSQTFGNISTASLGQNVQLVTANYSIQQSGQPRPTTSIRPGAALAALLTNSKAVASHISPGKVISIIQCHLVGLS